MLNPTLRLYLGTQKNEQKKNEKKEKKTREREREREREKGRGQCLQSSFIYHLARFFHSSRKGWMRWMLDGMDATAMHGRKITTMMTAKKRKRRMNVVAAVTFLVVAITTGHCADALDRFSDDDGSVWRRITTEEQKRPPARQAHHIYLW